MKHILGHMGVRMDFLKSLTGIAGIMRARPHQGHCGNFASLYIFMPFSFVYEFLCCFSIR